MEKFKVLRARLRKKLDKGEFILAPGAYDALTARVLERAGYEAVYMTGHGVGASMLAWTDVGLTTMTEMFLTIKNICNAINIPLITDMDTGYGNAVNVIRAMREFEQAGMAAFHIEDQAGSKKCGFMKGKLLVSKEEMVGKIRACVEAREDPNLIIIARCDARAIEGNEGMYDRLRAYKKAGADVLFPEAPRDVKDIIEDAKQLEPPLFLQGAFSHRYGLTFKEMAEMGYAMHILPELAFTVAPKAVYDAAMEIKKAGRITDLVGEGKALPWEVVQELIRLPEVEEYEEKFLPKDERAARWGGEKLPDKYFVEGLQDKPGKG